MYEWPGKAIPPIFWAFRAHAKSATYTIQRRKLFGERREKKIVREERNSQNISNQIAFWEWIPFSPWFHSLATHTDRLSVFIDYALFYLAMFLNCLKQRNLSVTSLSIISSSTQTSFANVISFQSSIPRHAHFKKKKRRKSRKIFIFYPCL